MTNQFSSEAWLVAVFIICILLLNPTYAADSTNSRLALDDPSLAPLFRDDTIPAYRLRAYGDINKDGYKDVIVSEDWLNVSQNGLNLFFYLGDSTGKYVYYDSFFESPTGMRFERDERSVRVWGYWHISAGEGVLHYYFMTDSGFVKGDQITIYSSPEGSEVSRAILIGALKSSDVDLVVERYRIVNGNVEIATDD